MDKRDRLCFLFALLVGACVLLGSATTQTVASGAVSCAAKDPMGAVIPNPIVVVTRNPLRHHGADGTLLQRAQSDWRRLL